MYQTETKTETLVPSGKTWLIAQTMLEKEVAEALGVPVATVRRLRYEGKIPYAQIGRGKVIYLARSVYQWLAKKEVRDSDGEVSGTGVEMVKDHLG